ncbi:MAG: PAS domain S-box protein [Methanoregula sp.]|uniref:PAS domain S-box protein n=1 Tax=Methanoregula sp. TaxID=2052170 RepID=UPI003BAFF726
MDLILDQAKEISRIREILKEHPRGLTIEDVAKMIPLNRTSTAKYLNTLLISGQADMEIFGRAKVFTLSRRIPFSQMLNLSSDLMLVLDDELVINQVNEPLVQHFGIARNDLIGKRIDQSPLISCFTSQTLRQIQESSYGKESIKLDSVDNRGKPGFFRIKFIPSVFDHGGKGLVIILEDLTELKQYQDHLEQLVEARTSELRTTNERLLEEIKGHQNTISALEQSEKKYKDLLENANSFILRTDGEGRITFISEVAEQFFGFSESDIVGKYFVGTIVTLPSNTSKNQAELNREFLSPAKHMMFKETEVIRKNGEKSWVAWTIKELYDIKENFREFLIIGMDITILKMYVERTQKIVSEMGEGQKLKSGIQDQFYP